MGGRGSISPIKREYNETEYDKIVAQLSNRDAKRLKSLADKYGYSNVVKTFKSAMSEGKTATKNNLSPNAVRDYAVFKTIQSFK